MQYSLQQMQSDIVETPQKSYYKSPSCAFRKRVLSSWILVLEVSPFVMSQKVLRAEHRTTHIQVLPMWF